MAKAATLEGSQRPNVLARFGQEHARVFFFSLGKLVKNPIGTLMTVAVIGITLALPAALHVLLKNVNAVSYSWESSLQASLFLKESVTRERGEALARELSSRPGVSQSQYLSREQALEEFRQLSGFGEALDLLSENPLPAVVTVTPRRELPKEQVKALLADLAQLPEVDQAKLDQEWLERLYAILEIAQRLVWLVAGLLALAVVVIVGNTVRLDIESRREEIEVMKLIGAPNSFIRRPFLYTGFWFGLLGAVLAYVFVWAALLAVSDPARDLAALYQSSYRVAPLSAAATLAMFGAGVLLAWFGAFWSVARRLSGIEPK